MFAVDGVAPIERPAPSTNDIGLSSSLVIALRRRWIIALCGGTVVTVASKHNLIGEASAGISYRARHAVRTVGWTGRQRFEAN